MPARLSVTPTRHTSYRPLARKLQAEPFKTAIRQRWAAGEVLFREGDHLGPILKITSGVALVSRSVRGGQRQILRFLVPGDVCGYLSEDGRYSFDGEAITDLLTRSFPRKAFEEFADRNAEFNEAIREELSGVLGEVGRHLTTVGQMTAISRIASFLLDMRTRFGVQGTDLIHLPMSRTNIGDYLGLRVETVSRSFTEIGRRRLIAISGEAGEKVSISDPRGLAVLAGSRRRWVVGLHLRQRQ